MAGGNLPFGLAPSGDMTSYTPTLSERATDFIRRKLFSDDRAGQQKASRVMDVAQFTPFGFATDMYDAGRAGGQGDYATAGTLMAMAGLPGPNPKGFRAYHGSPHSFDKFDLSKIGTGEGAQAYGHGLYFAENEGIAKGYRENLSDARYLVNGQPMSARTQQGGDPITAQAINAYWRFNGDKDAAVENLMGFAKAGDPFSKKAAAFLKKAKIEPIPGSMYEVQINADPNSFLDWDKPLSEQPESVKDAINRVAREPEAYGMDKMPDDSRMVELQRMLQDPKATSRLKDKGVPGIKYLDAGSRTKGDGSRNYVVFDDKLIEILRKYGWAGALPLGFGAFLNQDGTEG
jgi:hypothetical protein